MKLPNPALLTAALAAVVHPRNQIEENTRRRDAMAREIDAYIQGGDPSDATALQKISGLRIAAEMIPNVIARLTQEMETQHHPLIREIERFEGELTEGLVAQHENAVDRIEKHIKPLAPDLRGADGEWHNAARALAYRFPAANELPTSPDRFAAPALSPDPHSPNAIHASVGRATALLRIHENAQKREAFAREDFTWG